MMPFRRNVWTRLEAKVGEGVVGQAGDIVLVSCIPGDGGRVQYTRERRGGPRPVYLSIPNAVFWVWGFGVLR